MAYAPYYNDIRGTRPRLLGEICHAETGVRFEYAPRTPEDLATFAPDYPHRIFVGPNGGDTRAARILTTVAYVAIDENPDGSPVVQKWKIKQHRVYPI